MASEARNPEIRRDPVTNRWVIFSPARAKRPTDFKSKSIQQQPTGNSVCPFCIGNEKLCAPEIFRVPPEPQWNLRVIQNMFPALKRGVEPHCSGIQKKDGLAVDGFGFHDVVIEAPVHSIQLVDMEAKEIGDVILAYKRRILQIACYDFIEYIQVFKNHGASAGASLSHSHSQILALPIVPPSVVARLDGTRSHYEKTGKCFLCEEKQPDLVIEDSTHFVALVPFAATFAFEIWIIPRDHSPHFQELHLDKATELGGLLKVVLQKMNAQLNDPPFNFMIQTAPLKCEESQFPYTHWFLQIVPQLTGMAGFEMGTGCYINPVFSEDAAKLLRDSDSSLLGS